MKQNKSTNDLKREFLQAVVMGDKERASKLRRRLLFAKEMPFFIDYTMKDGRYYLAWEDQVLTKAQFDALKADCPQKVFWEETKTYEPDVTGMHIR